MENNQYIVIMYMLYRMPLKIPFLCFMYVSMAINMCSHKVDY